MNNIANVCIVVNYAKYTNQDVVINLLDIEKAFDTIQFNFVEATMYTMGFGHKMSKVIYWMYLFANSI